MTFNKNDEAAFYQQLKGLYEIYVTYWLITFKARNFVTFQQQQHYTQKLRLIQQALLRIENNQYGTCLFCFKPIAVTRLRLIPYTPYCMRCQSWLEESACD